MFTHKYLYSPNGVFETSSSDTLQMFDDCSIIKERVLNDQDAFMGLHAPRASSNHLHNLLHRTWHIGADNEAILVELKISTANKPFVYKTDTMIPITDPKPDCLDVIIKHDSQVV